MALPVLFLCSLLLMLATSGQGMPDTISMDLPTLAKCSCSNPKWCEPITGKDRKEQYAFSVKNDEKYWNLYDWSKLTTVVTAGYFNMSLVCLAHSHSARVIYMAQVDKKTFMDADLRKQWIEEQLSTVKENFLDGLNFDYEDAISKDDASTRDAYSALVRETRERFLQEFPDSLIAVDVGWRPNVDERYYDYAALAQNSDFLVVMAYDEQSQIYGECLAGPNCPYPPTARGVQEYLDGFDGQITPDKLVLAVPWFGISYECLQFSKEKCYIKKIPFRGAPCSDSPGQPQDYKDIHKLRLQMPDKFRWNGTSFTPYIMYMNQTTNVTYQIQYDNPQSLKMKYNYATSQNLRGIGIFHIDMLDYSDTSEGIEMRKQMFGLLPPTKSQNFFSLADRELEQTNQVLGQRPACPCSDPKLCEPIKDTSRKEVVAFSTHNDKTHWQLFDWSKLTTVIMFNYVNTDLMCMAHSHGVRVVTVGNVNKKTIFSPKLRTQWVHQNLQTVYNNYLDGINFDVEDPCSPAQKYFRRTYTALVRETSQAFRKIMPHTQISVDVILEATSHYRYYDYRGLARYSDFLFIMAYDEDVNKVGPNSGYRAARWAIKSYLRDKIPAHKIVLGLPWYGDLYECSHIVGEKCEPARESDGLPISQVCYSGILDTLKLMPDHYRWNSSSQTPYFSYKSDKLYQMQYDNPKSLNLKYQLAAQMGVRGVGFWHIDCLDYSASPEAQKMRESMFGPLPSHNTWTESKDVLKFVRSMLLIETRKRALQCYIEPVLMYGCEAWTISKQIQNKLEATEMWFLRRMLRIPWTAKKTNERVLNEANKR
ncbi:Di-n-acetylchitobiase [Plakobranchus ocellatus]|uniref:Di-n-acetylchitobiase n=1 Tax=Plakobranchus ocellatus TaxID=259542 RepID=A0AAV4AHF4_9GAST|nr:Di-n-acetylchitobiase [Plakobranchus ocellatus]